MPVVGILTSMCPDLNASSTTPFTVLSAGCSVGPLFHFSPFRKRPGLEEVQSHRWLNPADYMTRKRERAQFPTNRILVSKAPKILFSNSIILYTRTRNPAD